MKWIIPSILAVLTFMPACGRSHPLAEWEPDEFAPGTPERTWSANWWPEGGGETPTMQAAPPVMLEDDILKSPLNLSSSLDVALTANPETRVAWANARAAAAEYGISRGDWYPEISVWANGSFNRSPEPFGGPNNVIMDESFIAGPGASLTYTLLDFGRREAMDDMTARALLAANLRFNREIQDVAYKVQSEFFALEAAHGLMDAAEMDLRLASTVLQSLEERLFLGLATMPEVLEARQAEALAGYEVQVAKTAIHDSRTNLLVSMGIPPSNTVVFDLNPYAELPDELAVSVDQLTNIAMAARPDLAAKAADVQAAKASVKAAEADLNPQNDLFGMVSYQYIDYNLSPFVGFPAPNSGSNWDTIWSAGVEGSWLIFDGEIRHNRIRKARAELMAAKETMRRAQLNAAGEVWDAYFDYDVASQRHEWSLAVEATSLESLDAVQMAFDTGLQTLPDLLSAQQMVASARSMRIQSRADVLTAAAAIVHATGDLKVK